MMTPAGPPVRSAPPEATYTYERLFHKVYLETSTTSLNQGFMEGSTHEKTSTDRTTDSNHSQMPWLHLLLQERILMTDQFGRSTTVNNKTPTHGHQSCSLAIDVNLTYLVAPGARLNDSQFNPILVALLSKLGS